MVDNPATTQQTAEQIESQADFGRELTALRESAGLRIRDVGRLSGIPVSTVGDYFSGRHLPAERQQLIRILEVCGETDPDRIAWWEAARQRVRRLPGRRTGTPYRGLARFEQQDARWFFGREDVTEHLVALAAESSALPLVLVGPSGAGKSSLLRAGLLPRLSELAAVAPEIAGPVIVLEPTATPVADLKARLAELAAGPEGAEGGRPAVIVDQFEAVFTECRDEAQRRDFITELCELAGTALVILALRADFYDQAIRYPGLASALQSRQVVLSPMTADQVAVPSSSPPGWPRWPSKTASSGCCSPTWRRGAQASTPRTAATLVPPADSTSPTPPADPAARTSGARCRCCRTQCWPPGNAAGAARWRSPTTWRAAGSGTPSRRRPSAPTAA